MARPPDTVENHPGRHRSPGTARNSAIIRTAHNEINSAPTVYSIFMNIQKVIDKPTPFTGNTGRERPCRSPTWSPKLQNLALLGRVSKGKGSSERFLSGAGSAPLVVARSVDGPPPETKKKGSMKCTQESFRRDERPHGITRAHIYLIIFYNLYATTQIFFITPEQRSVVRRLRNEARKKKHS